MRKIIISLLFILLCVYGSEAGQVGVGQGNNIIVHGHKTSQDGGTIQLPTTRVHLSSGYTVTCNTYTKVLYNTELVDNNSSFSGSRLTPKTPGYYFLSASDVLIGTNITYGQTAIYKNGVIYSVVTAPSVSGASSAVPSVNDIVYMNGSTDYAEIYILIHADSGCSISGATGGDNFSSVMVTR